MLNPVIDWMEAQGAWTPWLFLAAFLLASILMIWRLESMSADGFDGTVLGTLVMPYCSGMGNLVFAFILGQSGSGGAEVMTNSLVNNITNMTLVLGLPAVIWGMNILPKKRPGSRDKHAGKGGAENELNRLSLLLSLLAGIFFTGAVWAMGRKGHLDFSDALVLTGLFLFWQVFHVFEVLKAKVRQGKSRFDWMLPVNLLLLAAGACGIYISTQWLVQWVGTIAPHGWIREHLGWISGWIMVLPNALLAFYYAWRKRPEVVYASQVGDAHVSIPLCLGIFALHHKMPLPGCFETGVQVLLGATLFHTISIILFGGLPRVGGLALLGAYAWFLKRGLLG